jgi:hypothetical protein
MTTQSEQLRNAMIAWDRDNDQSIFTDSRDAMESLAVQILSQLPGVKNVIESSSTTGSTYLSLFLDCDDDAFVTVRLSNHKRKPNGHSAPAWSFEPSDSLKLFDLGFKEIEKEIKSELAFNTTEVYQ